MKYLAHAIPTGKRVLVTSDIHGHDALFTQLLQKAAYSPEDILVVIGDIIDKGSESLKTLRRLMRLAEHGQVIALIGNVDAWRLYQIDRIEESSAPAFYEYVVQQRAWYGTCFYEEMAAELGLVLETPQDILDAKEAVIEHFAAELDFLANLPTVVETERYVFVHGGLRDQNMKANLSRNLFDLLKYDQFAATEIVFDKYVVVGHWATTLYCKNHPCNNPIMDHEKHILSIDGGCGVKRDGQLNMLILPHIDCSPEAIDFVACDDFPVFVAPADQAGSQDSLYINWLDNSITVLEEKEEFSYCRHTSTGKTLWIYNQYIWQDKTSCGDSTDYRLPVAKGDRLSLLLQTSRDCLVKKDGTIGWYLNPQEGQ
jgi:protein phosphatase